MIVYFAIPTHDFNFFIPLSLSLSLSLASKAADTTDTFALFRGLSACTIDCSEDFYRNELGICLPECGQFSLFDSTTILTSKIFLITACSIGLLSTVFMLVIFFLRFKNM